MLAGIDYFVVIAYLVGLIILGLYFRKFVRTSKDFFLGGKTMPFWAIGMSLVVSDIGAIDFVGIAGQAYRYGVVVANFDWIGCFTLGNRVSVSVVDGVDGRPQGPKVKALLLEGLLIEGRSETQSHRHSP